MEICSEELIRLRRHFHAHPELSMQEFETSRFVESYLTGLGLPPRRLDANGLVATVFADDPEKKPTVVIRAEMDAIAVQETLDVPWKSEKDGVMHACGHDGILAVALVLAKLCLERRSELNTNVKFLFQPAEEIGRGTYLMLDCGALENPRADYFVMFHFVNDAPSGVELQKTPASAVIGSMEITIHGKASHWCVPELGIDSIQAAAKVLTAIEEISNTYETDLPFVLGVGTIHGGTAKNALAESTHMEGNIRAGCHRDYYALRELLLARLEDIQTETGVSMDIFIEDRPIPPIQSDGELVDIGLNLGREIWGDDCRLVDAHHLSGDSAAFYFHRARGIFAVFTAEKNGNRCCPLHSGAFDFDEGVMDKAVEFLCKYIQALPNPKESAQSS